MPGRKGRRTGGGSAFRQLQDKLKWVDLVIEVADARLPESSRHPRTQELFGGLPRLIVLAKADLADPEATRRWLARWKREGCGASAAQALDLKRSDSRAALVQAALLLTADKRQRLAGKGLLPRPMRALVAGLPNVGKSSLVNWLVGRRKTRVADRPGVTTGPQWVRIHPQLELLDSPGILPPTAFGEAQALRLALLNLVPEKNYDIEVAARDGLHLVESLYPGSLRAYACRQGSLVPELADVAVNLNCLQAGGRPDLTRAARAFLADLRSGKLGRFTLDPENPPADGQDRQDPSLDTGKPA